MDQFNPVSYARVPDISVCYSLSWKVDLSQFEPVTSCPWTQVASCLTSLDTGQGPVFISRPTELGVEPKFPGGVMST